MSETISVVIRDSGLGWPSDVPRETSAEAAAATEPRGRAAGLGWPVGADVGADTEVAA